MSELQLPRRRLVGGREWTWYGPLDAPASAEDDQAWWYRIFHPSDHCPTPHARRQWGPLHRFDHHTITGHPAPPRPCPEQRTIIYLAKTLSTALVERYGDLKLARICPGVRLGVLRVGAACRVQDLLGKGCMAIGALPALCTGNVPRELSQEWARAIYRDQPAGPPIAGVRYRSAHDEGPCLALFERSPELIEVTGPDVPSGGIRLIDIKDRVYAKLADHDIRGEPMDPTDCRDCR